MEKDIVKEYKSRANSNLSEAKKIGKDKLIEATVCADRAIKFMLLAILIETGNLDGEVVAKENWVMKINITNLFLKLSKFDPSILEDTDNLNFVKTLKDGRVTHIQHTTGVAKYVRLYNIICHD